MKRTLLIVFFCSVFSFLSNAQSANIIPEGLPHFPHQNDGSLFYKPAQITTDVNRYTYSYDSLGNILSVLYEEKSGSNWINSYRYNYRYNAQGLTRDMTRQNWSKTAWVNSTRYNYFYNTSGKLVEIIGEYWVSMTWLNNMRYTYTYDNAGNEISYTWQNWIDYKWANRYQYLYTYNNFNKIIESLYQIWDNDTWNNSLKYTYTYNSSDNLFTSVLEGWYQQGNTWINVSRTTNYYDNSGTLLNYSIYEAWLDIWVTKQRITNSRDASGNITTELTEVKDIDGAWVNFSKYIFAFDGNGNSTHGESFIWKDNNWLQSPNLLSCRYDDSYIQVLGKYYDAVYNSYTTVKNEINNPVEFTLMQNYPNPFNPSTTINYSLPKAGQVKLVVYDALGSEASVLVDEYKPAGSYSVNFNGGNLSSGVYFYRLESNGFSASKKLILIK